MYYCDTRWHDGELVDAKFFIQSPDKPENPLAVGAFAACEVHVGEALKVMLGQYGSVRVRKVREQ